MFGFLLAVCFAKRPKNWKKEAENTIPYNTLSSVYNFHLSHPIYPSQFETVVPKSTVLETVMDFFINPGGFNDPYELRDIRYKTWQRLRNILYSQDISSAIFNPIILFCDDTTQTYNSKRYFWYYYLTIKPGINDQSNVRVYALFYFRELMDNNIDNGRPNDVYNKVIIEREISRVTNPSCKRRIEHQIYYTIGPLIPETNHIVADRRIIKHAKNKINYNEVLRSVNNSIKDHIFINEYVDLIPKNQFKVRLLENVLRMDKLNLPLPHRKLLYSFYLKAQQCKTKFNSPFETTSFGVVTDYNGEYETSISDAPKLYSNNVLIYSHSATDPNRVIAKILHFIHPLKAKNPVDSYIRDLIQEAKNRIRDQDIKREFSRF